LFSFIFYITRLFFVFQEFAFVLLFYFAFVFCFLFLIYFVFILFVLKKLLTDIFYFSITRFLVLRLVFENRIVVNKKDCGPSNSKN